MERIPDDELIGAYLDDELSSEERARAERLLVERADLRRLLEELRTLREGLRSLPAYHLGDDFGAAVLRRAEKEMLRENPAAPAEAAHDPASPAEHASPVTPVSPVTPASLVTPASPVTPASLAASGADRQSAAPLSASSAPTPSDPFTRMRRPAVWSILAVAAALLLMFFVPRADNRDDAVVLRSHPGGASESPSDRTVRKSNADFDRVPAGARPEAASVPAAEQDTSPRASGLKSDGLKSEAAMPAETKPAETNPAEAKTYDLKSSAAIEGADAAKSAAKSKDGRSGSDARAGGVAAEFEVRDVRQNLRQAAIEQQALLDRARGVELVDQLQLLDQPPAERERLAESLQSRLAAEAPADRPRSDVLIVEVYARRGAIEGAFVPSLVRNRVANVDVEQLARSDDRYDRSLPVDSFGATTQSIVGPSNVGPSQVRPSQIAAGAPTPAGAPSTNMNQAGTSPSQVAASAEPAPPARPVAVQPPSAVPPSSPLGGGGASPPAAAKPIAAKSAGNAPAPSSTASNGHGDTPASQPAGYAAKGPSAVVAPSADVKQADKKTRDESTSGASASGALANGETKRQIAPQAGAAPQLGQREQLAEGEEFYYVVADGPQLEALLNEISADNRNFVSVRVEPAPRIESQQDWRQYSRRSSGPSASAPLSYAAAAPGPATAASQSANSAAGNAGAPAPPAPAPPVVAPPMKVGSAPLGDIAGVAPAPAGTASPSALPDRRPPASGVTAAGRGEPPLQRPSLVPGDPPLAKSSDGQAPGVQSRGTQTPATQPAIAGKESAETAGALRAMPAPGLASPTQTVAAPTATDGTLPPAAGPLPPPDAYQSGGVEVPQSRAQRLRRLDIASSLVLEKNLAVQRGLAGGAASDNRPLDPSAERRMNQTVPLGDGGDQAARQGAVAGAGSGQPKAAEQGAFRQDSAEGQARGRVAPAAAAPQASPAGPSVAGSASSPAVPSLSAPASVTPVPPSATPAPPPMSQPVQVPPPSASRALPFAPAPAPSVPSPPSVDALAGGAAAAYGASGSGRADDYARRRETFDALTRSAGRQEALFIFRVAPEAPDGSAFGDRLDVVNERPAGQSPPGQAPASNPPGPSPASSQPTPPTQKAD